MNQPLHSTAVPAFELLALARRGAAHDVNNVLAVIRGNIQLQSTLQPDQVEATCAEIELACERLALLCDSWLLADPAPPPGGVHCHVADALQHVAAVVRATQEAEIRIEQAPTELDYTTGMDDRCLRALLYCVLTCLLRCGARRAIDVRLEGSAAGCIAHLRMDCDAQRQPGVVAPGTWPSNDARLPQSISTGLWDVGQCLQQHGGSLRQDYAQGISHLWLELPPAGI